MQLTCPSVVAHRAVFKGITGSKRPPRNAHLRNFQHYFSISLQLQLSILLLYYEEVLYFLFTQSVLRHSKSAETASAAGASPGTRLEELRTLPKYPSRPGRGHPLPNLHPSTPHFSEPSEFFSCMDAQLYLLALDSRYLPGASQPPDRNFRLEPPLTGGHQR